MPMTRRAAAQLLGSAEMQLFDASRRDGLAQLDERALRGKIERTRKLRDKARDLYQRQRLATRGRTGTKGGKSGAANARTQDKSALLTDILQRFDERLKAVRRPSAGTARAGAAKPPSQSSKRSSSPAKSAALPKASKSAKPAKTAKTSKSAKAAKTAKAAKPTKTAKSLARALSSVDSAKVAKPSKSPKSPKAPQAAPQHGGPPAQDGFMTPRAKAIDTRRQVHESRGKAIHAHIGSRNRRNQARRDTR